MIMANERFEVIYNQAKLDNFRIVRDKQTGVQYLQAINSGSGSTSITLLVDKEGKPLIINE
jgi:hypothetical protein